MRAATLADHRPHVIDFWVGRKVLYRPGDSVAFTVKGETVTGVISSMYYLSTKSSASGVITWRNVPAYFAVVETAAGKQVVVPFRRVSVLPYPGGWRAAVREASNA